MSLVNLLTPKNTEEIKSGLFVQRRGSGYRIVEPLAWDGKIRWKKQLRTIFSLRTFFILALVIFIAWSYSHDVKQYKDFYEEIHSNPIAWCIELNQVMNTGDLEVQRGLENMNLTINKIAGVDDGKGSDTNSLSGNS